MTVIEETVIWVNINLNVKYTPSCIPLIHSNKLYKFHLSEIYIKLTLKLKFSRNKSVPKNVFYFKAFSLTLSSENSTELFELV